MSIPRPYSQEPPYDSPTKPASRLTNTPYSHAGLQSPQQSSSSPSSPYHSLNPPSRHSPDLDSEIDKESSSLLDQLLPVPISNPDPSIRNQPWFLTDFSTDVRLISLRRVGSLTVIFIFGIVICWYAGMYAETPDMTSAKSVGRNGEVGIGAMERQREAMEDFRMGMERLSSFGAEVVIEEEYEDSEEQGQEDEDDSYTNEETGTEEEVVDETTPPPSESDDTASTDSHDDMTASKPKDWSKYTFLQTIPETEVAPDLPNQRFVFIGDVHGSLAPLQRLLKKISYNATTDKIIHVGDLIIKGPKPNQVLDFMREAGALGVRGNHDQKVIEWRSWMEWAGGMVRSRSEAVGGRGDGSESWKEYVDELDRLYGSEETDGVLASFDGSAADKSTDLRFPKDWAWRSEHWTLARRLPDKDYEYLLKLPLTLHLPAFHAVVVHAGLLARDPTMDALSENQLLPIEAMIGGSRTDLEKAILKAIPQNQVPFNLLEMRSVKKNGKVINSGKKGIPWSDIWNQEMTRCSGPGAWTDAQLIAAGYEQGEDATETNEGATPEVEETSDYTGMNSEDERRDLDKRKTIKHVKLPKLPKVDCSPVTVIYGHAASRGLDIQPFSKGLDSACVAGHQLTAMVLGDVGSLWDLSDAKVVTVDRHTGLLVSVNCKKGGK